MALPDMDPTEQESLEIELLLKTISRKYGYDFHNYSRESLTRRLLHRVTLSNLNGIADMIPKVLYDEGFFKLLISDLSIPVTEMFRDVTTFQSIREKIIPKLKTYARINVWHAGCSTGEEVYSLAIILKEEGILDKTHLYATDFNKQSLSIAKKGIFSAGSIPEYTQAYLKSGGTGSFSDYYHQAYQSIKMKDDLSKNISFAHHNLVHDSQFAEMHLVLCRNVLIYFNQDLQNDVLNLLQKSLIHRGFLILGNKENLSFTTVREQFDDFDTINRIYRKKVF